jgi:hypothetical protein
MLGRNSYTREELDSSTTGVGEPLAAYRRLAAAVGDGGPDGDAASALEGFEAPFFNNMVIVLDRYFVHRVRNVTGKDGNPLNEVELLADSLMSNGAQQCDQAEPRGLGAEAPDRRPDPGHR